MADINKLMGTESPFEVGQKINEIIENLGNLPIGMIISCTASINNIPEGTLPCDGAEYSATQFNDLYNNWLATGKLKTCTYDEYSNMLTTYGQCGMWAIDTTNKKFRVPLIIGKMVTDVADSAVVNYNMTTTNSQLFRYPATDSSGVTNPLAGGSMESDNTVGWGPYSTSTVSYSEFGKAYFNGTGIVTKDGVSLGSGWVKMNVDPNGTLVTDLSSAISTLEVRYFVVVATGSINQSMMDWSNWASSLDGKVNKKDLVECAVVVESSDKSITPSWYRVWSDGWCEQGGSATCGGSATAVTLLKPYKDINYSVVTTLKDISGAAYQPCVYSRTTTTFSCYYLNASGQIPFNWQASGYIK